MDKWRFYRVIGYRVNHFYFSYIEDWTKTDPNANPEESFESIFEKTFEIVRIDE